MNGRLMLLAQKVIAMVLQVQPTGREQMPREDSERIKQLLKGASLEELREVAAWAKPILAERQHEQRCKERDRKIRELLAEMKAHPDRYTQEEKEEVAMNARYCGIA